MAKRPQRKRTSSNEKKIQIINKQRKEKKKFIKNKKVISKKKYRRYSLTAKNRQYNLGHSSDSSIVETKKILLPEELLLKAKSQIKKNSSITDIRSAMNIYDVDENINYQFFDKCKKITPGNFKYLYTLRYNDRIKIMKKHKLNQNILLKSAKLIFFYLIQFLINSFNPKEQESLDILDNYKLHNFSKFIIPISEGNEELKFYYFIDIVLNWFRQVNNYKIIKDYVSNFDSFFINKNNLDKIEEVFYIIFRINLLFFNNIHDISILLTVYSEINEKIEEKMPKLYLIKDNIEENIDKIKVTDKTTLTLKGKQLKFKPTNYIFFRCITPNQVINNIVDKSDMSYKYFQKNRINYFDDEVGKKNAFVQLVNTILSSRVIKEYYQKIHTYKVYEFPFSQKNSKISEYLWNKVIYTDLDYLSWGITNREGFGIFINRDKGKDSNGLGYGANAITITHEITCHSLRILINSNNRVFAGTSNLQDSFFEEEDNIKANKYIDSGDKFELLLFGQKVTNLTIGGNHFLLNLDNWDLSLKAFRQGFKKSNELKDINVLKKELSNLRKNALVKKLLKNINYKDVTNELKSQSIPLRLSFINSFQTLNMEGFR